MSKRFLNSIEIGKPGTSGGNIGFCTASSSRRALLIAADTSGTGDATFVLPSRPGSTSNTLSTIDGTETLQNKTLDSTSPTGFLFPGLETTCAMRIPPTGWLNEDGSAVSRTTYANLFAAIVPIVGNVTISIGTPGEVDLTAHGFSTGDSVYLTTTGALPTGFSANTLYYVIRINANAMRLASTRANAYAGTQINTSGTQSGTHTIRDCPYGLGDGSTTFNLPDARGRAKAGMDTTSGTAAGRLSLAQSQGIYGNLGATGGEQGHTITILELAAHTHGADLYGVGSNGGQIASSGGGLVTGHNTGSAGGDTAHNNIQPTLLSNWIIKT